MPFLYHLFLTSLCTRIIFIHLKNTQKGHFLIGGKKGRGSSTPWALCVYMPGPKHTVTVYVEILAWQVTSNWLLDIEEGVRKQSISISFLTSEWNFSHGFVLHSHPWHLMQADYQSKNKRVRKLYWKGKKEQKGGRRRIWINDKQRGCNTQV